MCYMWEEESRGKISGSTEEFIRLLGCSNTELEEFFKVNARCKFADVTNCNGEITIINRRMVRDENTRTSTRYRVERFRKRKSNNDCNDDVTVASSSSSSSSPSNIKENYKKKGIEPVQMTDEIRAICYRLRDAILEDRPTTKLPKETLYPYVPAWGLAARHLLTEDTRPFQEVINLIEWASKNDFWGTVILDVSKLRKHYDKMKGQHEKEIKGTAAGGKDGRPDTPANTARKRMAAENKKSGKWDGWD